MFYCNDVYSVGTINSLNGFQFTNSNSTVQYGLMRIDPDHDMPINVFDSHNIDFNIDGETVATLAPALGLFIEGGLVVSDTGMFRYNGTADLIINNNDTSLGNDINFQITSDTIASLSKKYR